MRGGRWLVAAPLLTASLAVVLTGSGCDQKKHAECERLIAVINQRIGDLEVGSAGKPAPPAPSASGPAVGTSAQAAANRAGVERAKAFAEAMETLATETEKLELSVPELRTHADEYKNMARTVAKSARDHADAVEKKDSKAAASARSALDAAVKTEDPILERINGFCHGS